jgi:hypothetical protein
MGVYWFNNEVYCGICYRKMVPEKERKSDHLLDGEWFYRMFRDRAVQSAGCDVAMEYRNLFTSTDHSLR